MGHCYSFIATLLVYHSHFTMFFYILLQSVIKCDESGFSMVCVSPWSNHLPSLSKALLMWYKWVQPDLELMAAHPKRVATTFVGLLWWKTVPVGPSFRGPPTIPRSGSRRDLVTIVPSGIIIIPTIPSSKSGATDREVKPLSRIILIIGEP